MAIGDVLRSLNEPLERFSVVNIGFIAKDNTEDETQLDVEYLGTKEGERELVEFFNYLCPELNTTPDSVTYLELVKTSSEHWND